MFTKYFITVTSNPQLPHYSAKKALNCLKLKLCDTAAKRGTLLC